MRRWLIALAGSLLVFTGCGHEAIDFNNRLAGIHARLETAVEEFGRTLRPALDEGIPPSAEELGQALHRLRLRLPELPQASELYAAHQEFLAAQQSLLEPELAEIERLLDKQLTAGELAERLRVRFGAFKAAESRRLEAVHAAQRRFAEANRLKLTKPAE